MLCPRSERDRNQHRGQRHPSSNLYHEVKVPHGASPCNKKAPAKCRGFFKTLLECLEANGVTHVAEFEVLFCLLAQVGILGQRLTQMLLDAR